MERNSLFSAQSRTWTPLENEFLAENETIEIVPNFSCKRLQFIQGSYGPFHANRLIRVPLWLAITLKKSKKCGIKLPEWMSENELKMTLQQEKENETFCHGVPFYYREMSKLIFDIDKGSHHRSIRVLIQDIEDVRESKTKKGLKTIQPTTYIVHLNNIASNQINKNIRSNVCSLLSYFYDITKIGHNSDALSSTQNMTSSTQFSQSTLASNAPSQFAQENDMNMSNLHNHNRNSNQNNDDAPPSSYSQPMRKLRRLR
mmetsp:Transcript_59268/g.97922  ORF Transcript_59268/g.97922 Transcript_59268/m.97922 type:complete len:258 (-) Transcript_59268:163-936(-)|eukprot:CAMPEP_0202713974 /NCGR_PEP_ID=MMETSP1385-20130828/62251_1 /ASSEMBLY_ACC=CAM_ASM_000861 /TAXON_ID=933848 /ORGANISM="Elphidium margaritaceum" /LENGTH=257 /DNA_ID=CAMNT_0049374533 /DNA_START=40 /DNA_END=813 /DNA_ORIENTATION=+